MAQGNAYGTIIKKRTSKLVHVMFKMKPEERNLILLLKFFTIAASSLAWVQDKFTLIWHSINVSNEPKLKKIKWSRF